MPQRMVASYREREGVSSYQLGATSVNNVRVCLCKEIVSPADVVRVYTMAINERN